MIKFTDFEWTAFLYWAVSYGGNIGGDKDYIPLMSDHVFLECVQKDPENLSLSEIRERIIGFLNKWKCRIQNDDETALALKRVFVNSKDLLLNVQKENLFNIGTLSGTQRDQIIRLYSELDDIPHFSSTAITKTMHILRPDLFVMLDNSILNHYWTDNHQVTPTGNGYLVFLETMSQLAHEVTDDFHKTHSGSTPEAYLCEKLGYQLEKPIAKFIDEYNWIKFTKKLSVPPKWWPGINV